MRAISADPNAWRERRRHVASRCLVAERRRRRLRRFGNSTQAVPRASGPCALAAAAAQGMVRMEVVMSTDSLNGTRRFEQTAAAGAAATAAATAAAAAVCRAPQRGSGH